MIPRHRYIFTAKQSKFWIYISKHLLIWQEETVNNIIKDLLANIPVESVSDRGDEVEVEPEGTLVVKCCTSPKKQITLLQKIPWKKV